MAEVTFRDVGPDDEKDLRRWYDLASVTHRADRPGDPVPGFHAWAGHVTTPMPGSEVHLAVAEVDGQLVGWLGLYLSTRENLDACPAELAVHPDHRRRGHGRALVDEWARRAEACGRSRLLTEAAEGAGAACAAALGFRDVLADTQRRLDLTALDETRLADLLADARAHAAGYTLVRWIGASPAEHLPGMAALQSRMTTDAPLDDLSWEQEVYDADRLRENERIWVDRDTRLCTTAVVHDATGDLVGSTTAVLFADCDDGAYQWQTIVSPEHRGHRLGMLLKIENLAFLRAHEPALRTVDTWNADSNAHMLRVNLAMGFEVVRRWSEYEKAV
ncbi:MAG: GNAT family N-acetyltransferase [Sporichthyaceae bacterium]